MKPDKNKKIKEPYLPENTPAPPQIIDPSQKKERNEQEEPLEAKKKNSEPRKTDQTKQPGKKLLGESPIEIDDETTI